MSYVWGNSVLSRNSSCVTYKETEFMDWTVDLLDTQLTVIMITAHSI